jgi:SAM-dependent methyltransferase
VRLGREVYVGDDAGRLYGRRAALYARYRWDYAPRAIRFVLKKAGVAADTHVADLGSGPGTLARHFLPHAECVYCVEPESEMRNVAKGELTHYPSFRSVPGTAEKTGLPDDSVDLVTVGQALHWFRPELARPEMLRILKPEGRLAVFRNRNDSRDLAKAIGELAAVRRPGYKTLRTRELIQSYFGPDEPVRRRYRVRRTQDWDSFLGNLMSVASAPTEGSHAFAEFREAAREVFDRFSTRGMLQITVLTEVVMGPLRPWPEGWAPEQYLDLPPE